MDKLFIKIKDGQPFEHPMTLESIKYIIPSFDPDNLPEGFAVFEDTPFERNPVPFEIDYYEYIFSGAVVKRHWKKRSMTAEERAVYLQDLSDQAHRDRDANLAIALEELALTLEEHKWHWEKHIEALNAWELIDPLRPNIPSSPYRLPDGSVSSNYVQGSAPNVIG